jgi:hypothetical protein
MLRLYLGHFFLSESTIFVLRPLSITSGCLLIGDENLLRIQAPVRAQVVETLAEVASFLPLLNAHSSSEAVVVMSDFAFTEAGLKSLCKTLIMRYFFTSFFMQLFFTRFPLPIAADFPGLKLFP